MRVFFVDIFPSCVENFVVPCFIQIETGLCAFKLISSLFTGNAQSTTVHIPWLSTHF